MKTKITKKLSKLKKSDRLSKTKPYLIYFFIFVYIILFSYLSLLRHRGLKTQMNDLGNMEQPIYNTLEGNFMQFTNHVSGELGSNNRFGVHANFILLLFVPVYFIFQSPETLLIIQTVSVGLGALPLYWLGKKVLKNENLALLVPGLYLMNPMVHDVNLYDFHPLALAMPIIIFAFFFMHQKRYKLFLLSCFLLIITKEEMSLIVLMFGFYLFFRQKERLLGIILSIFSIIYFFTIVEIVMPYFNAGSQPVLISSRYSYLGDGLVGIAKNTIANPIIFVRQIFNKTSFIYLLLLVSPLAALPLLKPDIFLMSLPTVVINLLSKNRMMQYPFQFYHFAPILSFIFLSSIMALAKIKPEKGVINFEILVKATLYSSLVFSLLFSPAPYSAYAKLNDFTVSKHAQKIDDIVNLVPKEAPLSVQNNLGPHFSQRKYIYTYPFGIDKSDYVVLDVFDPYPNTTFFPRHHSFIFASGITPEVYLAQTQNLFDSSDFGILFFSRDGYLVLKRGHSKKLNDAARAMFEKRMETIITKLESHPEYDKIQL